MSSGEAQEPEDAGEPPARRRWRTALPRRGPALVAAVIVVLLLAGTTAAFAVTQSLKIDRPPVSAPRFDRVFSPVCGCEQSVAELVVRFRDAERVTVTVVDADERAVRTLATNQRVRRGDAEFLWDGRDDDGRVVADGVYRLQFDLARADRVVVLPTTIRVDTVPPEVEILAAGPEVISPDRDGLDERVTIRYRTSKPGTPVLRIAPGITKEGKRRGRGRAAIPWGGTIDGQPAPPGDYRLQLHVRDDAGNLSAPVEPVDVRVEYIRIVENELEAERGGELSFTVTTAAPFSWQLIRPPRPDRLARTFLYEAAAVGPDVTATLPRQARPGRYVLRVWRDGAEDTAPVRIRRPQ